MADEFLTLTDLAKINDQNLADIEVTDLLDDAPLLAALAADVASNGELHKYTKETGAPVVGFRAPNVGRENKKSVDTLVTITLKILDASFAVDKALAGAYRLGEAAYVAREARRHLKAAFFETEKQMINGTDNAADGFVGLKDAATLDGLNDPMVVDAGGGSSSSDDAKTSVWLIRTNADGTDCTLITGMDGKIDLGETVEQAIEDVDNGGRYTGLFTSILGWLGLQIGSIHSVGRIANIDAEASGQTLDDDLIYEALARFPASRQPNLIVMNRRSLKQLRQSRTATNATGAPAPRPTDVDGIPIITTDSIPNDDLVVS